MRFLLVSLLFIPFFAEGQLRDFAVYGDILYGRTRLGGIRRYHLSFPRLSARDLPPVEAQTEAMTTDHSGQLFVARSDNRIQRYDEKENRWADAGSFRGEAMDLFADSRNNLYMIAAEGVQEIASGESWYDDHSYNSGVRHDGKWDSMTATFMDRQDRIWMGFDYGEKGGNILVFDTRKKEFLKVGLSGLVVENLSFYSFWDDGQAVYATAQNGKSQAPLSTIVRFDRQLKATAFLESGSVIHPEKENVTLKDMNGLLLFTGAENDQYFYLCAFQGLYRGRRSDDLSKEKNWEHLVNMKPFARRRQRATGYRDWFFITDMVVLPDNRVVFQTLHHSIGYFDGVRLRKIN